MAAPRLAGGTPGAALGATQLKRVAPCGAGLVFEAAPQSVLVGPEAEEKQELCDGLRQPVEGEEMMILLVSCLKMFEVVFETQNLGMCWVKRITQDSLYNAFLLRLVLRVHSCHSYMSTPTAGVRLWHSAALYYTISLEPTFFRLSTRNT